MLLFVLDKFVGQGNSFHGVGGRACKRAQMRHCLRLMRSMASTGQEVVLQDFADQGAINQLISTCLLHLFPLSSKLFYWPQVDMCILFIHVFAVHSMRKIFPSMEHLLKYVHVLTNILKFLTILLWIYHWAVTIFANFCECLLTYFISI